MRVRIWYQTNNRTGWQESSLTSYAPIEVKSEEEAVEKFNKYNGISREFTAGFTKLKIEYVSPESSTYEINKPIEDIWIKQ